MTQHYVGTKILQAEPMTRGDYNVARGWQIPADENPADPGYRVVYPDGYVSWSPQRQFEDAYLPLGNIGDRVPHQQRMLAERAELDARLAKLCAFLETPAFQALDADERQRLETQAHGMHVYAKALADRVAAFTGA